MPWYSKCKDVESPEYPKEFLIRNWGQWVCVDGGYFYWTNTILIHLGDDPGQGENAFCQTALGYELGHAFLKNLQDECWYYEFEQGCPQKYIGPGDLCQ